jgi:membrane protein involved in D-alanine export
MLPFSSFEFFILIAIFIGIVHLCKQVMQEKNYKFVLFALNGIFLLFIYPKPFHLLSLIGFAYAMTYVCSDVFRFRKKIWGILLLLIPMLLVKLDIRFNFYPFELNHLVSFAGLSYVSFRILGYYMDKAPGEKMPDFISYFNFLSFSPTLLIGPIDRFARFKSAQDNGFSFLTTGNIIFSWNALVKGIAFKYVIAECIDRYWLDKFDSSSKELLPVLMNMYGYYAYLFFDFAGYSFMALGVGQLMGIKVPVNFTNPFVAVNPQDFWRRFHISLGDWLRDYFFSPLYMFFSRKKSLKKYPITRQNIALMLTFILMGCWNGFKANYIISGFLFGFYSAVHNTYVVQCKKKGKDVIFGNLNLVIVKIISIFIMLNLVAIALYIFSGRCPFV